MLFDISILWPVLSYTVNFRTPGRISFPHLLNGYNVAFLIVQFRKIKMQSKADGGCYVSFHGKVVLFSSVSFGFLLLLFFLNFKFTSLGKREKTMNSTVSENTTIAKPTMATVNPKSTELVSNKNKRSIVYPVF